MKIKSNIGIQVTLVAFLLLTLGTFWFATETAANLLKGDDWRFLLSFYKKWLDGTLQFRDLFSDHHPIVLHPLIYIFNAEFLSLQRIFGAWFGLTIKMVAGVLLIWKLFSDGSRASAKWLGMLFPLYVVLLFFGMNAFEEYTWPLLTYESSMTFLCGLITLIMLDSVLATDNARQTRLVALALAAALSLLLMGTLVKLLFVAAILAMLPIALAERKRMIRLALPAAIILVVLAAHSALIASLDLPAGNGYSITLTAILELATNGFDNLRIVAFGLAAGISSSKIFPFPSAQLSIFAAVCLAIVGYSIIAFYRERMWQITIIPVVLVINLLLTFLAAIVFRPGEIAPGTWPLYIPRYFPAYHIGWIGVIWIYYYKFRMTSKRSVQLTVAAFLSLGICFMLFGLVSAWGAKPYIQAANLRAEIALCRYANGDMSAEQDVPMWIRGHSFSQEGVQLLKKNKLNVFSEDSRSNRCEVGGTVR